MYSLLKALSPNQPPSLEQERAEQEKQKRIKEMQEAIAAITSSPKSVANDYYWDEKESQNVNNMNKCANPKTYKNYNSKYDEKVKKHIKEYGKPNEDELYDLCNAAIEEVDNASSSITKLFKNIIFNKKREKEIKETTINKFIDFYKETLQEDYVEKKGLDEFNTDPIFRKRVLCRCYIEGDDKLKTQVEEFIKKYSIQIDLDNCILKRIDKKKPSSKTEKKDNPLTFRDQLEEAVNIMNTESGERLYNNKDYKWAISILAEAKERMKKRQERKDEKNPLRLTKVLTTEEKQAAKEKKMQPKENPKWRNGGKRTKKSYKKSKKANTRNHKKSKKVTFKKNKKTRKH